MTSHFEVLDDASYVIGALSPADRQAFELHLSDCAICQASIQRLAGVPGLLALASPVELETDPPAVPTTLLPSLLRAASRDRHRRLFVLGGVVAAAGASLVALIVVLTGGGTVARSTVAGPGPLTTANSTAAAPSTGGSTGVPGTASVWLDFRSLSPGPLSASVQLDERQWGTNLVLNCRYAEQPPVNAAYRLVVIDRSGASQQVGWWGAVTGTGSVINAATSLHRPDIARLEVQLRDGTPLLAAAP